MKKRIFVFMWLLIINMALGNTVKEEEQNKSIVTTEIRGIEEEKSEEEKIEEVKIEEVKIEEVEEDVVAALIGDENGNVYYGENIDKVHPYASLTKLVTIMVVFDEIRVGRIKLKDKIEISEKISKIGGSKIKVKKGDVLTVEELIKASLIRSANNATYALADYVTDGNYDAFIKKMSKKVKSIGLENIVKLYSPAGLPDRITKKKMDIGTAYGVYKIMLEVMKYPEILEITKIKETKIFGDKIKIKNTNSLLGVEGIKGLKTGSHNDAGSNIAIYNEKLGYKNFYVVLGGKNAKIRNKKVIELDKKFHEENWIEEITNKETSLVTIDVIKGTKKHVSLYPDKNKEIKKVITDNIDIIVTRPKVLEAPLKMDEVCGFYTVYKNGIEIENGNLILKENIPKKWYVFW